MPKDGKDPAVRPEGARADEQATREDELPLDARLLAEGVVELNISRRNVGLYPPGHVRITRSIERAFELLTKLFEVRASITLGITRDSLVIDKKTLDTRNPVFLDCARSFHNLGLAGIVFRAGLEKQELVALHEIMTLREPPTGKAFVDAARERGITNLKLTPLDQSAFAFITDELRAGAPGGGPGKGRGGSGGGGRDATADFVHGLLDGSLVLGGGGGPEDEEAAVSALMNIPPEAVAEIINSRADGEADDVACDRVISAYTGASSGRALNPASMRKLTSMVEALAPEKREQFLRRAAEQFSRDTASVEATLRDMSATDIERFTDLVSGSTTMPDSLRNVVDKFSSIATGTEFKFDMQTAVGGLVHDIELGDGLRSLFTDDNFAKYVGDDYQQELESMMGSPTTVNLSAIAELERACHSDVVERVTSEIMLEVLHLPDLELADFMKVVTNLSKSAVEFVETGRFEEVLNIYTAVYSYSFNGRFKAEATGTIEYFFRSDQFLDTMKEMVRIWGRRDRLGVGRLLKAFKAQMIPALLDDLAEERNKNVRGFYINILSDLGSDIVRDVMARLTDKRWYVARNMLLLLRRAGRAEYADRVRPFMKHPDRRVWAEALRFLLHFRDRHGVPHLRVALQAEDPELRELGVKLAGSFRVKEVLPMLTAILEKSDMLGTAVYYKTAVVKALAEMADPAALPALTRAYGARSLLYRGQHAALQAEIARSLARYPAEAARPLLDRALSSSNAEVREAAENSRDALARGRRPADG